MFIPWSPLSLPVLLPVSSCFHTFRPSQPDLNPRLSSPSSHPPLSIPPSSHEFIMWSKIERWLFVPVPACHWSRMNNSATAVEASVREKKEIISEPYHSGYFGMASCQSLSCSAQSFFSLSSGSLSFLPLVHLLSYEERTDSSVLSILQKECIQKHIGGGISGG